MKNSLRRSEKLKFKLITENYLIYLESGAIDFK